MGRLVGGRYAIERRIGEGGMAEVLLARDEARGGAPVVVKRSRAHLAHQPEFAQLFLREARLASLIHHPNVVELEGVGEDDGQPYLVMEYLQGFTVREIFLRKHKEGGVPQDLAAFVVMGAARGLHAAHTAVDERGVPMGLMHRDVSPHNLFVTESGQVKVLDFGIAKGANEHTMTRAGHVKGKASYLAPEQLDPTAKIDTRADIFSLGIVAWELFTSRRLFRRATELDTINAIRALTFDRPAQACPGLDAEYSDIVMRMLARKPDRRPQTAADVARAFEQALARRDPRAGAHSLSAFVSGVRQIDPKEVSRASVPSEAQALRARTSRLQTPAVPPPVYARPPEEATADVAPPAASWMNLDGTRPPADGSVVGTFAVAGATMQNPDLAEGYEALDPDEFVLEASQSGLLPTQPAEEAPDAAASFASSFAALPDGSAALQPRTAPTPVAAPSPRTPLSTRQELSAALLDELEARLGKRPTVAVVVAVLVAALVSGLVLVYALALALD